MQCDLCDYDLCDLCDYDFCSISLEIYFQKAMNSKHLIGTVLFCNLHFGQVSNFAMVMKLRQSVFIQFVQWSKNLLLGLLLNRSPKNYHVTSVFGLPWCISG